MPTVNARFTADFDSFYEAVQRADYELKLFQNKTDDISGSLGAMVDKFSGVRIINEATLMSRAIEEVGGVSTLTAKEMESVGNKANEAVEKIKALGGTPPADLQRLADATRDAADKTTSWGDALSVAKGVLGALGVQMSLQGIINFGKEIFSTAESIEKMAIQTGMSNDEVQRLQGVADATGVRMGSLVAGVQTLTERLGKGDEGAVGALDRLGISFQDFMAASPYDQLVMISDGFKKITDKNEEADLRMLLWGRNSREMMPAVLADIRDIGDGISKMSDDSIERLNEVNREFKKLWTAAKVEGADFIRGFTDQHKATMSLLEGMQRRASSVWDALAGRTVNNATEATASYYEALDAVDKKYPPLEASAKSLTQVLNETAAADKELTKSANEQIKAHTTGKTKVDEHAKALADWNKNAKDTVGFQQSLIDTLWSLDGAVVENAIQLNKNGATWESIRKLYGLTVAEIKAVEAASKGLGDTLAGHLPTYDKTKIAIGKIGDLMPELTDGSERVRSALEDLDSTWISTEKVITATGATIGGTVIPMFSTLTTGAVPQNKKAIEDAHKTYREFGSYLEKELPQQMLQAFMGGGDIIKTIGASLGSFLTDTNTKIGETIGNTAAGIANKIPAIGGAIGGLVGTVMGPIGTMVGSFAGDLIGKLFGPNPEKEVNKVRESFVQAAGGLAALNEKAFQAGMTLDDLLGAKTMDDYTAAVNKLNAAFGAKEQLQTARDGYIAIAGGVDELGAKAWAAGTNLDAMLQAKTVEDYNAAIAGLTDAFAFQQKALDDVVATAEKYGIGLEQLGPALQRQELDKQAQQLFKDFETLNAAGLDTQVIAGGMADAINDYVDKALRMGAEIPSAMRPMLEDMARTGQLVDENGNKIDDLESSGLSFSMTMSEGFKAMIASVEQLTTVISRSLGVALDTTRQQLTTLPKSIDVAVKYIDPGFQSPSVVADVPGYQEGTHGHYLDFGRGSLVMLHGKEAVVPQGDRIGTGAAVGTGGVTINIDASGAFFDTPGDLQRLANKIDEALTQKYGLTNRLRAA